MFADHHKTHHKATFKKKKPFAQFDKMIKEKYEISDNMFENMSRQERNQKLKILMENENIVIFSDSMQTDGMPQFSIIYDNLKDIGKENDEELKKLKMAAKSQRNKQVDMGIPPPKKGEEK